MSERHGRATNRHHRERVIAKRLALSKTFWSGDFKPRGQRQPGRHAREQWDAGCHCANCGICRAESPRVPKPAERSALADPRCC